MMTNILLLEDGSEESSIIYNKIATDSEECVIYNNKEEFKKALRLSTVKNHFQYKSVKINTLNFVAKCLNEKCS